QGPGRQAADVSRAFLLLPLLGAALLAAASPALPPTGPSPAPDDLRLKQVRERKEALARQLPQLRPHERSLLGDVERLEVEVRLRGEELRETQLGLQRTQAQMDENLKRVRRLEATLAATRPRLAAHARALYKLGELSYLRMLLSVDRPS